MHTEPEPTKRRNKQLKDMEPEVSDVAVLDFGCAFAQSDFLTSSKGLPSHAVALTTPTAR